MNGFNCDMNGCNCDMNGCNSMDPGRHWPQDGDDPGSVGRDRAITP
jgi:hypothetical protein